MDNTKRLYAVWIERFYEEGSSLGPWSHTYPDEFVIWLADKLEESRNETNKKS
jgi:hypothetical protein